MERPSKEAQRPSAAPDAHPHPRGTGWLGLRILGYLFVPALVAFAVAMASLSGIALVIMIAGSLIAGVACAIEFERARVPVSATRSRSLPLIVGMAALFALAAFAICCGGFYMLLVVAFG